MAPDVVAAPICGSWVSSPAPTAARHVNDLLARRLYLTPLCGIARSSDGTAIILVFVRWWLGQIRRRCFVVL